VERVGELLPLAEVALVERIGGAESEVRASRLHRGGRVGHGLEQTIINVLLRVILWLERPAGDVALERFAVGNVAPDVGHHLKLPGLHDARRARGIRRLRGVALIDDFLPVFELACIRAGEQPVDHVGPDVAAVLFDVLDLRDVLREQLGHREGLKRPVVPSDSRLHGLREQRPGGRCGGAVRVAVQPGEIMLAGRDHEWREQNCQSFGVSH